MHIKILRGLHNLDMVSEVVAACRGAAALFLEGPSTKSERSFNNSFYKRIVKNDMDFETPEFKGMLATHPYVQIAYALRGNKISISNVDEIYEDGGAALFMKDLDFRLTDDDINLLKAGDYERYYQMIHTRLSITARHIQQRDKLVADQVGSLIQRIREKNPNVSFEGVTIVLVQGFLHNSMPYLKEHFPYATFEEIIYNKEATEVAKTSPSYNLLETIMSNEEAQLSRRQLDIFSIIGLPQDESSSTPENSLLTKAEKRLKSTNSDIGLNIVDELMQNFRSKSDEEIHECLKEAVGGDFTRVYR